jgi:uncharacterized membrane protein YhhN
MTPVLLHDEPALSAVLEPFQTGDILAYGVLIAVSFVSISLLYALESLEVPKGGHKGRFHFACFAAKGSASLAFVVAAGNVLSAASTINVEHASLFAALLLCAVGDLLLVLKRTFVPGVLTFLAGHVVFTGSFFAHGVSLVHCLQAFPVIALVLLCVKLHLFPHVPRGMMNIVRLYSGAISTMAIVAAGTGRPILFASAVVFIFSDIGVGQGAFIKTTWVTRASVFLYYAAQAAFVWSMFPAASAALIPEALSFIGGRLV